MVVPIMSALVHMHCLGIIHRDIKVKQRPHIVLCCARVLVGCSVRLCVRRGVGWCWPRATRGGCDL